MTTRILPPARAILWEYLARYPWLDAAIVGGFAALVALTHMLPEWWLVRPEPMPITLSPVLMVFFGIVFLFGANPGRPRATSGGYAARLFLYPISTARLVAWPMLFASAAMALGWLGVATLVLPRFGFHPPLALGALAAASTMAWLQALSWWPFGTSLAQLLVMGVTMPALLMAVVWPMMVWGWGPGVAWVLLPTYVVAAYALAVRGVAIDRRGDGRGGRRWLTALERIEWLAEFIPGARSRFASPARAQFWIEWKSKGVGMFILVAALTVVTVLFVTILPVFREPGTPMLGFLASTILQPLVICGMMGFVFAKDEMGSRAPGMSPFLATRPLTSEALAAAKLGASAFVLAVSCGFAALAVSLWVVATGNVGAAASQLAALARGRDAITVGLVATIGSAMMFVLTWKGMVGAMVPALTGRPWVTYAIGLVFTAAMVVVVIAALLFAPLLGASFFDLKQLLAGKAPPPRLLMAAAPAAIGLTLGLKLALSAVAFRAAIRRGLIARRRLGRAALLWAIPASCFLALGALLLRPPGVRAWLTLAMLAALLPPLGRLPAASLALDWDRHR